MVGLFLALVSGATLFFLMIFSIDSSESVVVLEVLTLMILLYVLANLSKYQMYHPMVLMLGAYFVLILAGTMLFDFVKGRSYNEFASVLVYSGFISMFCGIFLSRCRFLWGAPNLGGIYSLLLLGARSKSLIIVVAILGLAAFLTLVGLGGIPLLAADVDTARLSFYSGKGYLNFLFMALPIVAVAFLFDALSQNSHRRMAYAHIFALIVVFLIFLTGFRSASIKASFLYLLTYMLIKNVRINYLKMAVLFIVLFSFLILVGAYRRGGGIDMASLTMEAGITIVARPAMLEMILNHFDSANIMHGAGYFADFRKLLPGSQVGQNVDLKYLVFPNADKMPALAGVTPSLIGEAYLNFGKVGVIIVPFVLGFLLGKLQMVCVHKRASFFFVVFYMTLLLESVISLVAGIGTRLPQYMLILFWVVVISILYGRRVRFV